MDDAKYDVEDLFKKKLLIDLYNVTENEIKLLSDTIEIACSDKVVATEYSKRTLFEEYKNSDRKVEPGEYRGLFFDDDPQFVEKGKYFINGYTFGKYNHEEFINIMVAYGFTPVKAQDFILLKPIKIEEEEILDLVAGG